MAKPKFKSKQYGSIFLCVEFYSIESVAMFFGHQGQSSLSSESLGVLVRKADAQISLHICESRNSLLQEVATGLCPDEVKE